MKIAEQKLPIGLGATGLVVEQIQRKLIAEGAELIPDGDYGTITVDAVSAFQHRKKLNAVGFVGPKTAAALDRVKEPAAIDPAVPSVIKVAPWLSTMRAISGTREFPGAGNNPVIMQWREVIGRFPRHRQYVKTYTHDSIAWCGLGMAYVLAANSIDPITKFLWALNWAKEGDDLMRLDKAVPGAIMAFSRQGGGHVAIYERETPTHWVIRGCNQSDMVSEVQRAKGKDLKGIMWPRAVDVKGKPVKVAESAVPISGSEA